MTEHVDEVVFECVFTGEFDAVTTMDQLCECGCFDVDFVQHDSVFLVVSIINKG